MSSNKTKIGKKKKGFGGVQKQFIANFEEDIIAEDRGEDNVRPQLQERHSRQLTPLQQRKCLLRQEN